MSSSESFYWHDYETSGADVSTARPMQFAGLRTDLDLNVIGEPLVIYSKLTPDVLPHPAAIRVTGITPQETLEKGLTEAEFIAAIHAELSAPKTCGIGYNSIGFDDEITRYALYRNFYDPYQHTYSNGNSRWDLVDVARAYYALRPDGIEWPKREDGYTSFRLEHLTAANGLEHGAAHDALSDVTATIEFARLLKRANNALFTELFSLRGKRELQSLVSFAPRTTLLYVSGKLGGQRNNITMVLPLCANPQRSGEYIFADLQGDLEVLTEPVEVIQARLFAKRDELPEGVVRPGLISIRLNQAPVLLPTSWAKDSAERLGWDGAQLRAQRDLVKSLFDQDAAGMSAKLNAVFVGKSFAPRTDPDTMLYDGFISDSNDKRLCERVRTATSEQLTSEGWVFKDQRLPELFYRYRARNFSEGLSSDERAQWQEHCRQHIAEQWGTDLGDFKSALSAELANPELSDRQVAALKSLETYASEIYPL